MNFCLGQISVDCVTGSGHGSAFKAAAPVEFTTMLLTGAMAEYSASVFDRSLLASLRTGFACFGRHKPQRRKMSLEIDIGMDSSATAPTGLTVPS